MTAPAETYRHAVARPLERSAVLLTDGHWRRMMEQSRTAGLPRLLEQYENRNVVRNFIAAAAGTPRETEENAPNYDEFLYKALEAAACWLAEEGTDELRAPYERLRGIVLAAQQPDGYLNTQAISEGLERFSGETRHEMYAGGHLMQAGIAELRATGETVLFEAGKRHVDRLIRAYTEEGRTLPRFHGVWAWPDHPNLELALVELYRVTGEERYLGFCRRILDAAAYPQRTQMLNHAVCELLHAAGATDYWLETGEDEVRTATERLYRDLLRKVYVTGGVGAANRNTLGEAVGKPYQLGNADAYAETCAAISLVFWSWRLFLATGAARYVDLLERALYNGVQAGIARNGYEFFYVNPLEYHAVDPAGSVALGVGGTVDLHRGAETRREHWPCSCCPPNVHRLLAALPTYLYAAAGDRVWVNLYAASRLTHRLPDGTKLVLEQQTDYPWDGRVRLTVSPARPARLTLKLRLPAWCEAPALRLDGEALPAAPGADGYLTLEREWRPDQTLDLELPMPPRLVGAHPRHIANYGKAVLMRGPLVYCLEEADQPATDLFGLMLPRDGAWRATREAELLGGIVALDGEALLRDDEAWAEEPYPELSRAPASATSPVRVRAIPYYAWANRGRGSMVTALPVA